MDAALELSTDIGKKLSCFAFDIPRASFYRFHNSKAHGNKQRADSPIALSFDERKIVVDLLHSEKY